MDRSKSFGFEMEFEKSDETNAESANWLFDYKNIIPSGASIQSAINNGNLEKLANFPYVDDKYIYRDEHAPIVRQVDEIADELRAMINDGTVTYELWLENSKKINDAILSFKES